MAAIDTGSNDATLTNLRSIRSRLYAIPEDEVNEMSEEDQTEYGNSLYNVSMAVTQLETAQLKEVNDGFKAREDDLKEAALSLENDLEDLTESVEIIRAISKGLGLVTDIVKLLG